MEPKLTPNGVSLLTRNFTGFPSSVLATLDQSIMVKIEEYMDIISQGVLVSDDTGASTFVKVQMEERERLLDNDLFYIGNYWKLKVISYSNAVGR